jgi:hypothetical protein
MDYAARGNQLIAWGKEEFTVEPCGIEASSEFALVFDLSERLITRLLVVEDLPSFLRGRRRPVRSMLPRFPLADLGIRHRDRGESYASLEACVPDAS